MDARSDGRNLLAAPRAVLFDMDGTLTRPMLDFDAIRVEIGIRGPILEALRDLDDAGRKRAMTIVDRHEKLAAERSELNNGCRELLASVASRRLPTAIVTRNSRASVDVVLRRHGLSVDAIVCRDAAPPKPDARAVLAACEALGVAAGDCWMIGDGEHDVEAGNAAGATTIWLRNADARAIESRPMIEVSTLTDVLRVLDGCLG